MNKRKRHWLTTKTKRDNCGQTIKKETFIWWINNKNKGTLVDKQ